jgi:oligopeptide/dipeptide ABC transporter ATP-binding protein
MNFVDVVGLKVAIPSGKGLVRPVREVSLQIESGQALGLVGESGCGKTITSMALAGLLSPNVQVSAERFSIGGVDMRGAGPRAWRSLHQTTVGVVFQNPMKALNPRLLVSAQLAEAMLPQDRVSLRASHLKSLELMDAVGVDRAEARLRQYPHELSGGLAQRVVIAMALARGPKLLIADEPTTALDASVQKQILDLIDRLRRDLGLAVLMVTHDLGVVQERVDQVAVMYAGRIVERGTAADVIERSSHPYTAALVAAMPSIRHAAGVPLRGLEGLPPPLIDLPTGCALQPRCALRTDICGRVDPPLAFTPRTRHWAACHNNGGGKVAPASDDVTSTVTPLLRPVAAEAVPIMQVNSVTKVFDRRSLFGLAGGLGRPAVSNVSLSISAGETLGIVGESGSGKTTVARMMVGLETPTSGDILFRGKPVADLAADGLGKWRRDVQFVFQDSSSSLNPRFTIARSIEESLLAVEPDAALRRERVLQLLSEVGLTEAMARRRPDQLSGGQRQRVGIARALARNPSLMIADEPVSALDVSVQATILNLLNKLRRDRGMSCVIISHDLGVIKYTCDNVIVMYHGSIVEAGKVEDVLWRPKHEYTRKLVDAAPGSGGLRLSA